MEPSGPVQACNGIALPFTTLLMEAACYSQTTVSTYKTTRCHNTADPHVFNVCLI